VIAGRVVPEAAIAVVVLILIVGGGDGGEGRAQLVGVGAGGAVAVGELGFRIGELQVELAPSGQRVEVRGESVLLGPVGVDLLGDRAEVSDPASVDGKRIWSGCLPVLA
jgi:hypothetical protein